MKEGGKGVFVKEKETKTDEKGRTVFIGGEGNKNKRTCVYSLIMGEKETERGPREKDLRSLPCSVLTEQASS